MRSSQRELADEIGRGKLPGTGRLATRRNYKLLFMKFGQEAGGESNAVLHLPLTLVKQSRAQMFAP